MKKASIYILFISVLVTLISCGIQRPYEPMNYNPDQVFSEGIGFTNEPGKCYAKSMNNEGVKKWTEVFCHDMDKGLINELQTNLRLMGYQIEDSEFTDSIFGSSTKQSITDFQKSQDMSFGIMDGATVMRIRYMSR